MTRNRWQIVPEALFVILVLAYCSILARAQSTQPEQNAIATHSSKATTKTDSATAPDLDSTEIMDAHDPRFGVPSMPKGNVSLIGGTVTSTDPIRQRLTIRVFGNKNKRKMTFSYDERSHLFLDGKPASYKALQKGAHVYVDSMLLPDNQLLARNVRVVTSLEPADARGQITQYQPRTGTLIIMDELSQRPIYLRVGTDTKITGAGADSRQDLVPGSLVSVRFASDYKRSDIAREITILATPGNTFTFAGTVTYLDMKDGVMAVHNQSDDKTYELHFDEGTVSDNTTVGSDVVVNAEFQGTRYKAKSVKIAPANSQSKSDSPSM